MRQRIWNGLFALVLLFSLSGCGGQESAAPPAEGGSFEVHFIDVGQADAALVVCDGLSGRDTGLAAHRPAP